MVSHVYSLFTLRTVQKSLSHLTSITRPSHDVPSLMRYSRPASSGSCFPTRRGAFSSMFLCAFFLGAELHELERCIEHPWIVLPMDGPIRVFEVRPHLDNFHLHVPCCVPISFGSPMTFMGATHESLSGIPIWLFGIPLVWTREHARRWRNSLCHIDALASFQLGQLSFRDPEFLGHLQVVHCR